MALDLTRARRGHPMKRRAFIAGLGGAAALALVDLARAQDLMRHLDLELARYDIGRDDFARMSIRRWLLTKAISAARSCLVSIYPD